QPAHSFRSERGGATPFSTEDTSDSRTTSLTASSKLVQTVFEAHSFVAGLEFQLDRRNDARTTLQGGVPILTEFGDNLHASEMRYAGYAQDEWSITPTWAVHAGLRWEGIQTRGSGFAADPEVSNRSSVWSPLLHAVWKPDPKSRDQVRLSLTRSYRSPTLGSLIARPSVNSRYPVQPVDQSNTPTQTDRAGNPNLKPELATGIDLAVERYLPGSGILSANIFRRNISDYMRSVTQLETVSYSSFPRYVIRPQNVGDATTEGLELEAKLRVSEVWPGAPKVDVRANASFFKSKVKGVPGPDNRLDQQPDYTANVGGDYRFSGWPLMIGGNLNWTPGYLTRISEVQTATISGKLVGDIYALWTFNPGLQLRLTASNFAPRDYITSGSVDFVDARTPPRSLRETSTNTGPTYVNVQARLELKL
ncbi:MAG: TonB-dependent receptor, partial [Pseudomonadota bacterium]|nr:TonB-dependent receptor [Pseudomonadota bacterium]